MAKKDSFNYFDFFNEMIDCANEAADELCRLVNNFSRDQLSRESKTLRDIEHKADQIKHRMLEQLLKEFLPPFERDDIISLSSSLDDIVDCIDDVALSLYMYDIKVCRPDAAEFAAVVKRCCDALTAVLRDFSRYKKLGEQLKAGTIEVNRIEGEGDQLYSRAVRKLFTDGTDAITVCAWKEVYACFEGCCDACEQAADQVEAIILKN